MSMSLNLGRPETPESLNLEEPIFRVKARDLNGATVARYWTQLFLEAGGSKAMAELALRQADAMEVWPNQKLPDIEGLEPEQIDALEIAFDKRGFRFDAGGAAKALDLAYARGRHEGGEAARLTDAMAAEQAQTTILGLRQENRAQANTIDQLRAEIHRLTDPLPATESA